MRACRGSLAGCGGGGGDSAACDVASQKTRLRSYMPDWYYWSGLAHPDPAADASVADYFQALWHAAILASRRALELHPGQRQLQPQFFAEGRAADYGLFG